MKFRRFISEIWLKEPVKSSSYLKRLPAVKFFESGKHLFFDTDVTFFVGDNGSGKSTLLEAIAVARGFNPEGGGLGLRAHNFSTEDTHSDFHRNLTIARGFSRPKSGWFLRAESFYNDLSYLGAGEHGCSHGEAFLNRIHEFRGEGLYLMDEPEAALSPARQMDLICAIHGLVEQKSQFIIATHSPILMGYPGARILFFSENGISEIGYRDTEHYQITKRFLDAPEKMYQRLFGTLALE